MSEYVSTENRDLLRQFFLKVNKDAVFRKNFLENPVEVLSAEGITLNPKAKEEVQELTAVLLRKLPELSAVPTGFDEILEEVAQEGELVSRKRFEREPDMLIL